MTVTVTTAIWQQPDKPRPACMLVMLALAEFADDRGHIAHYMPRRVAKMLGMKQRKLSLINHELQLDGKLVVSSRQDGRGLWAGLILLGFNSD